MSLIKEEKKRVYERIVNDDKINIEIYSEGLIDSETTIACAVVDGIKYSFWWSRDWGIDEDSIEVDE